MIGVIFCEESYLLNIFMKLIGEILNSTMTSSQVDSILVTAYWPGCLKKIGYEKRMETKAVKWRDGLLTVNVCTSQILMELQMQELVIIAEFDRRFGEGIVRQIKYRLGRI